MLYLVPLMKRSHRNNKPGTTYTLPRLRALEGRVIYAYRRRLHALGLRPEPPQPRKSEQNLVGLALSGGGVRSATFPLGFLQALAQERTLCWVDYISSVSGGGYISAWLAKWLSLHRYEEVLASLASGAQTPEPAEVHRLRQHTSYLTPRLGLFGHDVLSFITTYVHHLLLMVLLIGVLLMYPRLLLLALKEAYIYPPAAAGVSVAGASFALLGVCLLVLFFFRGRSDARTLGVGTRWVRFLMMIGTISLVPSTFFLTLRYWDYYPHWMLPIPFAVAAGVGVDWVWNMRDVTVELRRKVCAAFGVISAFGILLSLYQAANEAANHQPSTVAFSWRWELPFHLPFLPTAAFPLTRTELVKTLTIRLWDVLDTHWGVYAAVLGLLAAITVCLLLCKQWAVKKWLRRGNPSVEMLFKFVFAILSGSLVAAYVTYRGHDLVVRFAEWGCLSGYIDDTVLFPHLFVPILAACAALGAVSFSISLALFNLMLSLHVRQTVALTITHFYKYIAVWFITAGLTFYGPIVIYNWRTLTVRVALGVWAASLIVGFTLTAQPEGLTRLGRQAHSVVAHVAAYVFLTGIFLCVAWLISYVILQIHWEPGPFWSSWHQYWIDVDGASQPYLLVLFTGVLVLLVFLSARFGINQSSLHLFYQAKLAQAYLDEKLPGSERFPLLKSSAPANLNDLVRSRGSKYLGPYLVFNAAMNLAEARQLEWQEGRAANFIFSRLFSGFELPAPGTISTTSAFQKTGALNDHGAKGMALAHAMSISASAIGSNMGSSTSPRVRFFNTIFNIRLGWWFANPRFPISWAGDHLQSRVNLIWDELMGHTNADGPFVHLSDGGHFENLGLYELVRRRCRLIIVSDATEDASQSFRSLGVAVQRCRIDLGIEISIDLSNKHRKRGGNDGEHEFYVGWVLYRNEKPGVIVYLKAQLTEGVPVDVLSFKVHNPDFPNEPTANQWFHESQFESYRYLGFTLGRQVAHALSVAEFGDICKRAETLASGAS